MVCYSNAYVKIVLGTCFGNGLEGVALSSMPAIIDYQQEVSLQSPVSPCFALVPGADPKRPAAIVPRIVCVDGHELFGQVLDRPEVIHLGFVLPAAREEKHIVCVCFGLFWF